MRFPIGWTLITALISLTVVVGIGLLVIEPPRPLLVSAGFILDAISPNADGLDDVTQFDYEISRSARVSLTFEGADGLVYVFRDEEPRADGTYSVLFSGVVDGYTLPGDEVQGEVLRRLMPDGEYTWRLRVVPQDGGEPAETTGSLTLSGGSTTLPEMVEFTVAPDVFTPNQDGVDDRVMINIYLTKEAELDVFLVDNQGRRLPLARREEGREEGEPGRHTYDYEGGVDIGADPPPDGTYSVVAISRDPEGQEIQRMTELTIRDGGKPRAEIVGQPVGATVVFDVYEWDDRFYSDEDALGDAILPPDDPSATNLLPVTMRVGDMLVFKLTVWNYGPAPIRTSGPPPGTVYEQTQLAATLGEYEQSGVWRVGIQCETSSEPYPWRWAIGTDDDLLTVEDPATGNTYYYLPPGGRAVVWGGIRMTERIEAQNPQGCWAGLIHEDVEISIQNSNVGRREIELAETTGSVDN